MEDEAFPMAALNHRWPRQAWGPWVDEAGRLLKGTGPGCIHWWLLTAIRKKKKNHKAYQKTTSTIRDRARIRARHGKDIGIIRLRI